VDERERITACARVCVYWRKRKTDRKPEKESLWENARVKTKERRRERERERNKVRELEIEIVGGWMIGKWATVWVNKRLCVRERDSARDRDRHWPDIHWTVTSNLRHSHTPLLRATPSCHVILCSRLCDNCVWSGLRTVSTMWWWWLLLLLSKVV